MEITFEKNSFAKRLTSMLKVDFRRAFTSLFFYIMLGISLLVPILILVMTTMMDGSVSVDPQTGKETVMEGFDFVWQIFGAVSSFSSSAGTEGAGMQMDLVSMCNINMMYFGIAVLVCVFISADFKSGYAKNLFTVRARKTDYVISKTLVGFVGASLMFIAFFIGAMLGGMFSRLPFTMDGFTAWNLVACMGAKILLALVFVAVCVLTSVIGKQRTWLSILLSLAVGMLFFTMIPMITPLDSTFTNVLLCLIGGTAFAVILGIISNVILRKTALV